MLPGAVVPIAETTRSGVVESVHFGAVVALDADGITTWWAGDPHTDIYPRSALKPLQAQAMVGAGFTADAEELAVAAASHNGEPVHLDVVRRILASAGLDESALGNTPALPLSPPVAADVLRAGGRPAPLLQNCSGKHAAMLSTCVANGWEIDGYLEFDHPVQKLIDSYIATAAGGVSHTGIDGCGAPTAMVTLVGLAFAVRTLAIRRTEVYEAMSAHPHLVAGTGREDTALIRAVPGLLAKGGAEGVHVVAHSDGRAVAVKVADGSEHARVPVMLAAMRSLGFDVDGLAVPSILGHGRPVGEVRFARRHPHTVTPPAPIWAASDIRRFRTPTSSQTQRTGDVARLVHRRGLADAFELRRAALEVRPAHPRRSRRGRNWRPSTARRRCRRRRARGGGRGTPAA